MNKFLFLILILSVSIASFSQKKQGRISYDINVSSDDPQTAAYISGMEGSILELYFGDDKIRSEMFLGDFMTTVSIMHKGNDSTLTLLDGMMGKIAMKSTLDDLDDEQRLAFTERRVDLIEGETKEIMGYKCKKAIITTPDEKEAIIWYTSEIVPDYRSGQYLFEEIEGVPLYIDSFWGNMKTEYVAFEYKKKLKKPEKLFDMEIPKGYTRRTMEEMNQMRRGGQR